MRLIVCSACALGAAFHAPSAGATHADAPVDMRRDAAGVSVRLTPSGMDLRWSFRVPADVLARAPYRWTMLDGQQLPYFAFLLAVHSQAVPQVRVLGEEVRTLRTDNSGIVLDRFSCEAVGISCAAGAPVGDVPVHVEEAGTFRGVRLVRVMAFPLLLVEQHWRFSAQAQIEVDVQRRQIALAPQHGRRHDPSLDVLRMSVVNAEDLAQVQVWPAPDADGHEQDTPARRAPMRILEPTPRIWIEVGSPGLVHITRAVLDDAQFPAVSPHRLRLRQGNTPIAMLWEGDDDDDFEPDERLLFFAWPRPSRYAAHDAWVLEVSDADALRMSTRDAAPHTLSQGYLTIEHTFEQNQLYMPDCVCGPLPFARDGERWTWVAVQRGQTHAFALNASAADLAQPAELTVWLIGYTDTPQNPDHRAQVWLNGALLGEAIWDGKQAVTANLAVPAGLLTHDATVSITLPGIAGVAVEGMWVDALRLRTRLGAGQQPFIAEGEGERRAYAVPAAQYVLDVTDSSRPAHLLNAALNDGMLRFADPDALPLPRRYAVITQTVSPARVRAPMAYNPAAGEYHIITHADFSPALSPLVAHRQAQGLSVVVQTTQAIYDHFGDGRPDPLAIRDYLAWRYAHDDPRPFYVLLVGDGTFDPRRYRDASPPTWLPPLLADVEPFMGETAADNRLVTVDGDDALPDMAIGRLPVNTPEETERVIAKILSYEEALLHAAHRRVVFVADNRDQAGDFPARAHDLSRNVPRVYTPVVVAMSASDQRNAARDTLLNVWNGGAYLIAYLGHASPRQWAAERLFHRDDVGSLEPASALPVVLAFTCYTAKFHDGQDTLDEILLRSPLRGASAVWGATGLSISSGHEALSRGFLQTAFRISPSRLGEATLAGKLALAAGSMSLDLLDTYTLLGDPAMPFNQRFAFEVYLPSVQR